MADEMKCPRCSFVAKGKKKPDGTIAEAIDVLVAHNRNNHNLWVKYSPQYNSALRLVQQGLVPHETDVDDMD